ncbi:acrosin-like [Chamaea fasciata]|uniref:acrosin-like n=1 Tax=Chamaea fasciata TaxID=190680 RepID=UPI003369CB8A
MLLLYLLVLLATCRPLQGLWNTCEGSCGIPALTTDDDQAMTRVVGGTNAEAGAWPWLVSIQDSSIAGTGHLCGGSLISVQWVLTAAHCFADSRNIRTMRLVIGATQLTEPGPGAEVRLIKRLLVHEEYNPADQSNDIALLELNEPVQCSPYIQLACVPNVTVNVAQLDTCYVAGWGATTARSQSTSDVLQEAKVRLISVLMCNSTKWYDGDIHNHNLCAGYPEGGIDTCQGDSGGPLMCRDNSADFFWVVGVTSWGRGCARAQRPGVYTSVQHFYDWILVQMEQLPQVEASRAWGHETTTSQPWAHQKNTPWPPQKPWPRPPPTQELPIPAQEPWPRPPPTQKPWPRPIPAQEPWPRPPPTQKPWPRPIPAQEPWPRPPPTQELWPRPPPTQKPWPRPPPTQKPWPSPPPTQKPWPRPPPTQKPSPSPPPTQKPCSIPPPAEEINTCPFPLKKLMEFFTQMQKLLKSLQGIRV